MRVRCPRCQAKIAVPDDWIGRTIRCKGCNKAFTIPKPRTTIVPTRADAGLDLEGLARLERGSQELDDAERAAVEQELKDAQPPAAPAAKGQPAVRTCPSCKKQVTVDDPNVDVLCSNCWEPIPALVRGAKAVSDASFLAGEPGRRRSSMQLGFYEGLAGAFAYPMGALTSLITSMAVSIGIVLIPVVVYVGISKTVEQGQVGLPGAQAPAYLTGLRAAVIGAFVIEIVFFAGVAVHALLDVIRTTSMGAERPPGLVWNPSQWGGSVLAYASLIFYYAVCLMLVLLVRGRGHLVLPASLDEARALMTPTVIGIAAVFTFFVPMNLIGMAVGSIIRGLNPVSVVKSIAATHVNYLFLFVLLGTYVTILTLAFGAVLNWFSGVVQATGQAAGAGDVMQVAGGMLSWGVVMGFGFFGVYVLGRLHGLFARTFQRQLAF